MEWRIGKKGICRQCNEEKYIVQTIVRNEGSPYDIKLYCTECFETLNKSFCDICDEEVKCDDYEIHLLDNRSREQMAKQITINKRESVFV
jgi:hypothetical protein